MIAGYWYILGTKMFKRIKEYFRKPKKGDIWVLKEKYASDGNPFNKVNIYRYTVVDVLKGWVRIKPIGSSSNTYLEYPISNAKSIFTREI